jgi:predicted enzyme related to lactoylglutathione lyase
MLNSADYQKLADFYGQVLQKKPEMVGKEHSYVGYLAGNCFISIAAHDKVHGKSQNPERLILFFETNEVEAEFNRIKDIPGASVIKEPHKFDDASEATIATLADPDGNYFQLVTSWNE